MPDRIQRPVSMKELDQYFTPRGALKETPIAVERRFHVAADRPPQITTRLERIDRGDGHAQWEVIDRSGKVLARWKLPKGRTMAAVGNGVVYTVRTDDDALRYVQLVTLGGSAGQ